MATLYTHQSSNIRKTWMLMFGFVLIIGLLGALLSWYFQSNSLFILMMAISLTMTIASFWFSDKIVTAVAGAKPISKQDNEELYRLVENLCIAAGLPTPRIYLINDPSPNAFATGRDPNHAIVAVTSGLLKIMDKQELEGVLAHELSHIGNRDMLIATVAAVLAGVITIMVDIMFRTRFFHSGGGRKRGGGLVLLLLFVAMVLAPFAAMLIRLAVSRSRETMADASGALLTRYPEGLANALEKIARAAIPLKNANNMTAHLYISDPMAQERKTSLISRLFMTHPPVEERIRLLKQMSV